MTVICAEEEKEAMQVVSCLVHLRREGGSARPVMFCWVHLGREGGNARPVMSCWVQFRRERDKRQGRVWLGGLVTLGLGGLVMLAG